MTNTPEQTLSDLLALGEKAVQFTDDRCIELGLAARDALPAIREYMEEVKGLMEVAERLKEMEAAVGEWIAAQDAWPATVATAKATREAVDRLEAAEARLRSLMEKK